MKGIVITICISAGLYFLYALCRVAGEADDRANNINSSIKRKGERNDSETHLGI